MLVLSALYCKLLVVIGLAFPLSEVISPDIPPFYYNVSFKKGKKGSSGSASV